MKRLNKIYYALKKYDKGFIIKYYNISEKIYGYELYCYNRYINNCWSLCYSFNETKILIKHALKRIKTIYENHLKNILCII